MSSAYRVLISIDPIYGNQNMTTLTSITYCIMINNLKTQIQLIKVQENTWIFHFFASHVCYTDVPIWQYVQHNFT